MSLYFITKGHCYIGKNPRFVSDDNGGSVAVGEMNEETNQPILDTVNIYGDWQASKYLEKILELVDPDRDIDIPDFKFIIKKMCDDGVDICDYCNNDSDCNDCIVDEWKED